MDESTPEQWGVIITETMDNQPRVADRVLELLGSLEAITDGFAVDQLTHSLQTAARAEADGADDEMVVASLCHDIGKAVSVLNHPRIAAEILRPYVRPEVTAMIEAHQDFQGRHYYEHVHWTRTPGASAPGRAVVRPGRAVRRRLGPDELRSRLPHARSSPTSNRWCARSSAGPGTSDPPAPAVTAGSPLRRERARPMSPSVADRQHGRLRALQNLVIEQGAIRG